MIDIILNGKSIALDGKTEINHDELASVLDWPEETKCGIGQRWFSIPNSSPFSLPLTMAHLYFQDNRLASIAFVWGFASENPGFREITKRKRAAIKAISKALGHGPAITLPFSIEKKWTNGKIQIIHRIYDRFGYEESITLSFV